MAQFQKAMEVVDKPYLVGGRFDPQLQPGVRRLLVMTIYSTGVARYDRTSRTGKYLDTVSNEHKDMVADLAQSEYFNRSLKLKYREPEHVEFMVVATMPIWPVTIQNIIKPKSFLLWRNWIKMGYSPA